jgi:hypothetical protein
MIWVRIKEDYWAYIVILIALGIALYALMVVKDYENQCNEHWIAELEQCNCACIQRPAEPWQMPNVTLPIYKGGEKNG